MNRIDIDYAKKILKKNFNANPSDVSFELTNRAKPPVILIPFCPISLYNHLWLHAIYRILEFRRAGFDCVLYLEDDACDPLAKHSSRIVELDNSRQYIAYFMKMIDFVREIEGFPSDLLDSGFEYVTESVISKEFSKAQKARLEDVRKEFYMDDELKSTCEALIKTTREGIDQYNEIPRMFRLYFYVIIRMPDYFIAGPFHKHFYELVKHKWVGLLPPFVSIPTASDIHGNAMPQIGSNDMVYPFFVKAFNSDPDYVYNENVETALRTDSFLEWLRTQYYLEKGALSGELKDGDEDKWREYFDTLRNEFKKQYGEEGEGFLLTDTYHGEPHSYVAFINGKEEAVTKERYETLKEESKNQRDLVCVDMVGGELFIEGIFYRVPKDQLRFLALMFVYPNKEHLYYQSIFWVKGKEPKHYFQLYEIDTSKKFIIKAPEMIKTIKDECEEIKTIRNGICDVHASLKAVIKAKIGRMTCPQLLYHL